MRRKSKRMYRAAYLPDRSKLAAYIPASASSDPADKSIDSGARMIFDLTVI
jgi:hypothetical protein